MARSDRRRSSSSRDSRRRAAAARRRRQAREPREAALEPSRARRVRFVGGAVATALVVLVGVVVWLGVRDDGEAAGLGESLRTTVLAEQGDVLPVTDPVASYRVVYRLESMSAQGVAVRTEEIRVRRPFDGRVVSALGEDGIADPELDVRSTMGRYADATATGDLPTVAEGRPASALGDLRVDGVLEDLVRIGLFEPRERREVLGRECQVYRTGQALETLVLARPTDEDHADVCIDATGILLEQVAVVGGEAQVYEIATELDLGAPFGDDVFAVDGEAISVVDGGSELEAIDPSVAPTAGYWSFPAVPEGYEHVGRYLLRSAVASDEPGATSTTVGVSPVPSVETYVDVYVDGTSFLVVQQGPADAAPTRATEDTTPVEAGSLGDAVVSPALSGSVLAATTPTGFLELVGTRSAADLGTIAAALVVS
jgi:hypothetical protein